jgi:hypothetical protein
MLQHASSSLLNLPVNLMVCQKLIVSDVRVGNFRVKTLGQQCLVIKIFERDTYSKSNTSQGIYVTCSTRSFLILDQFKCQISHSPVVSCGCCHTCKGSILINKADKSKIAKPGIEVVVDENIHLDEMISDI